MSKVCYACGAPFKDQFDDLSNSRVLANTQNVTGRLTLSGPSAFQITVSLNKDGSVTFEEEASNQASEATRLKVGRWAP